MVIIGAHHHIFSGCAYLDLWIPRPDTNSGYKSYLQQCQSSNLQRTKSRYFLHAVNFANTRFARVSSVNAIRQSLCLLIKQAASVPKTATRCSSILIRCAVARRQGHSEKQTVTSILRRKKVVKISCLR